MNKESHIASAEWGAILATQTSHLRACARKFLRDAEAVNDLAQDAMVKALQNEHLFDGANIKAWLATIVRNHFITAYQRKAKYQHMSIDAAPTPDWDLFCHCDNTGEGDLSIAELQLAIESISDECGSAIQLRTEGYKYEEIAKQLNVPIGTVKNRIFRGRQQLIDFFKSKQHNPNRMEALAPTLTPAVSVHVLGTVQPPLPDGISEQQHDCDLILSYLLDYLPVEAFRYVDRDAAQLELDVKRFTLDTCFPVLVEHGYLEVEKQGQRKAYRLCGSMYALTARHLSELLDEKAKVIAQAAKDKAASEKANKPAKPAIDFFQNPAKTITSSPLIDEPDQPISEEQKQPETAQILTAVNTITPPHADTSNPVVTAPMPPVPATIANYGFMQYGQLVWFTDKQEAADSATAWALAERQDRPVDLVQRIGEVKVQPTVTFF